MTTTPRTTDPLCTTSAPAGRRRRIAIIGGGASGTLTALNLLRSGPETAEVTVFEPSGRLGRGVAYSTTDARHLLNVRAHDMSALRDVPDDLLDWAAETGRPVAPSDFVPRRDYAVYLQDRVAAAGARHPGRLRVVASAVTDVEPVDGRFLVATAGGVEEEYDVVVLAYGNPAPRPLSVDGAELPEAPWHLANPWDVARIAALPDDATVVLVGTGLTAIDTAITLLGDAPGRRVVMVSRHGLLPEPHSDAPQPQLSLTIPEGPLTADGLARFFEDEVADARARGIDWRAVVNALRAPTQSLWQRLPESERIAFLARYARHWEVRRHRMAPQIAALIDGYRREGRLAVCAGGLVSVDTDGARPVVELADAKVAADAVVNCTGPLLDVTRTGNPLLRALRRRGIIAPDPLRLGVLSTPEGEVLDAAGRHVPGLFTVGPPRKGVLFETTAIPEIRVQAAEVAGRLVAAR
ncbi:FAD/NAD(P)-binding protein [Nocardioides cheoyonin]|uniref:FAD/NAD(P)-binding protein n=1 Tax=Nocardioides cheoyonin TaxID=3156615 RepID=UPI0032B6101E